MGGSTKKFQQDYRVWRMGFLLLLIVSVSLSLFGQSAPVLRSTSNRTEREGKARSGALEATIRSERAAAEPKLKSEKQKEEELRKDELRKARKRGGPEERGVAKGKESRLESLAGAIEKTHQRIYI